MQSLIQIDPTQLARGDRFAASLVDQYWTAVDGRDLQHVYANRFRMPSGHLSFRALWGRIAGAAAIRYHNGHRLKQQGGQELVPAVNYKALAEDFGRFPVYVVDSAVIDLFNEIEVQPEQFEGFSPPLLHGLFSFPQHPAMMDEYGDMCRFLVFRFLPPGSVETIEVLNQFGRPLILDYTPSQWRCWHLLWSTVYNNGTESGGTLPMTDEWLQNYGGHGREFVRLILNLSLALTSEAFITNVGEENCKLQSKGFRRRNGLTVNESFIYPRRIWLDSETRRAVDGTRQSAETLRLGGTHASPRPHWRKEHTKRVPCGPKGANRKIVTIPRRLVNPYNAI